MMHKILTSKEFYMFINLIFNASAFGQCNILSADKVTELIDNTIKNSPVIQTATNNIAIAQNEIELNVAPFDPVLQSKNFSYVESFYSGNYNELVVYKRNQFLGSTIEAGVRRGAGNFPIYEDEFYTASGLEFFSKITVPILRDLDVDQFRLDLEVAKLKTVINQT